MKHDIATLMPADSLDLLAYWQTCYQDNLIPHRSAIDPFALRQWLGSVGIVELQAAPKRFFVRLHGVKLSHHLGANFQGSYLEDSIPETLHDYILKPYHISIQTKRPVYSRITPGVLGTDFERIERLILPFREHDENPSHFLLWLRRTGVSIFEEGSVYGTGKIDGIAPALFDATHQCHVIGSDSSEIAAAA